MPTDLEIVGKRRTLTKPAARYALDNGVYRFLLVAVTNRRFAERLANNVLPMRAPICQRRVMPDS